MKFPAFIGISNRRFLFILGGFLCISGGNAFGAEGGGGLTVIPDVSVFIQIANFLVLIWVLNLVLYRPIRNVLLQRKEKVNGLEQNIETASRDLQDKEETYAKGIKEARSKGLNEKDKLLQAAEEEEKKFIAQIHEKAQSELNEVKGKITKEAEAAKATLMQEIEGFAKSIGEKILGRAI